jgi:bacillithiol system protein YtxJ
MSKINWLTIEDINNGDLFNSNCVIFKHSKRCIISRMVLKRFYLVDVINQRDISNKIATHFDLNHESPQLLLIKSNTLIHSASHSDISFKDLDKINC